MKKGRRLLCYYEIIDINFLDNDQFSRLIDELYPFNSAFFGGIERSRFEKVIKLSGAVKNTVQLVRDENKALLGYTAFHIREVIVNDIPNAVMCGEVAFSPAARGNIYYLIFVIHEVLEYKMQDVDHATRAFYWIDHAVSALGYLSLYQVFKETMYPNPLRETPTETRKIKHEIAQRLNISYPTAPLTNTQGKIDPDVQCVGWQDASSDFSRLLSSQNPGIKFFIDKCKYMVGTENKIQFYGLLFFISLDYNGLKKLTDFVHAKDSLLGQESVISLSSFLSNPIWQWGSNVIKNADACLIEPAEKLTPGLPH